MFRENINEIKQYDSLPGLTSNLHQKIIEPNIFAF